MHRRARTSDRTLRFVVGALGAGALLGCQAARHATSRPAGSGPNAMLDPTAVGRARCETGGAEDRPFVVEWDATDLASFEALAARDLVIVRYAGCSIEVLSGCSDAGVPGVYGRYEAPTFTSGTLESLTMANEDELYAKLPLGAAAFSGTVQAGETLELRYYVSGLVRSTRDQLHQGTLAGNPRCLGATHYVAQYNLGAFALDAQKRLAAAAEGGVKAVAGRARTASESTNLKEGGKLESCETAAQRQCRVPIRLVLRRLAEGAAPPAASAPAVAPAAAGGSAAQTAYELRRSAMSKLEAGDGAGCLADLDRADALDASEQGRTERGYVGSQCKMVAGDCAGGRRDLTEFYRATNRDRRQTDAEIARTVDAFAEKRCPTAKQASLEAKITHVAIQIGDAKERGDVAACRAEREEIERLVKTAPADQRDDVGGLLTRVVDCLDELGECDEARATFRRYYALVLAPRLQGEPGAPTADELYRPQRCPAR